MKSAVLLRPQECLSCESLKLRYWGIELSDAKSLQALPGLRIAPAESVTQCGFKAFNGGIEKPRHVSASGSYSVQESCPSFSK